MTTDVKGKPQDAECSGPEYLGLIECRELLGPVEKSLTDEQVQELRDFYYVVAGMVCDHFLNGQTEETTGEDIKE